MSLSRPVLSSIIPFDAVNSYSFKFTVVGGDQIFGSRIIIKNNSTNVVVVDNIVTSFLLAHDIPNSLLTNGVTYNVTIATKNEAGTFSSFSDAIIFKCLSTPIIAIDNLTENQIVHNNNFTVAGTYSQTEDEVLSSYIFYLYDGNGNLLQSSPEQFYAPLNTITYTFSDFENNANYGIKLSTITQSGIENNTDIIPFTIEYVAPQFYGNLDLVNVPNEGAIQVTASVIQIIGKIGSGSISYENNEFINLTNGMVYFDNNNGMTPFSNFTLRLWVKGLNVDESFLKLVSPQGYITLTYSSQYNAILVEKIITGHKYMIFGQTINLLSTDELFIELKQINNYLDLKYEVIN